MKWITVSLIVISVAVIVAIYLASQSILDQPFQTPAAGKGPAPAETAKGTKPGAEPSAPVTTTQTTALKPESQPGPPRVIPSAPVGLIASPLSATAISLAWNDNSDNESGFLIERRDMNSADYTAIAAVGAGVVIYTDESLKPSTGYYYRVRAFAEPAYSPYSNETYAVTLPAPRSAAVYTAAKPQPAKTAPTDEKPATKPPSEPAKKESPIIVIEDNAKWKTAAGGFGHSVALKTNGTLWIWGTVTDIVYKPKVKPAQLGIDTDWAMIACGYTHTVALKSDGTIWTWSGGNPERKEDGTIVIKPIQLSPTSDWAQISCNEIQTVAIKTKGTLWMWDNTKKDNKPSKKKPPKNEENLPIQLGDTRDWAFTASGYEHHMAVKLDGSLWAWGNNNEGQLGLSDTISRTMPTRIIGDPDWVRVACGTSHTVAIKTNGTLWGWGENDIGQLGLGHSLPNQTTPAQVGGDRDWVMVSAGHNYTVALKRNGSLWAWGANFYGQLGLGDKAYRDKPTLIGTDADWEYVACGSTHTIAIKANGTMWAWGSNYEHQLGFLAGQEKLVPTQVAPY